ncbi:MAG: M23 family metallopeptidase [Bacteroidales bacterium]|nr:M23 family metallopeptidase [Bacteroidales bacterium]
MITTFPRKQDGFLFCLAFLFMMTSVLPLRAQEQRIKTNFRSPVEFPLYLSGTFGELRAGHFHSGIDIKTDGVTGKKVYAVASGYISRINVSLTGYGNALYITHPDGYVSVYGHLERFNPQIQAYVRKIQYQRQSFTVELFPPKGRLPVKKGEVIAYSGESGGADGPHLHFEVREAKTEFPVNPLLFEGIHVVDHRDPKIYRLAVYKTNATPCEKDVPDTTIYLVSGSGKDCFIKNNPVIKVSGPFSLGVQSNDVMDHVANRDGDYSIKLYEDDQLVWGLEMNKISFFTTRYINSLIDYNYYEKTDRRLVRTEIDTNNRVPNYFSVQDSGIFRFQDDKVHHFKYEVSDIYRNTSVLKFSMQEAPAENCKGEKEKIEKKPAVGHSFRFNRDEKINTGDIRLNFPKNTFYRSFLFRLKEYPQKKDLLSSVYEVGTRFTPVQRYFDLSIKVPKIDDRLLEKLYIGYAQDDRAKIYNYAGGKFVNGWLETKARTLGCYAILADTIKPVVKPVNFKNGTHLVKQKSLKVIIEDKPTGIRDYRPTLNGHWILMEYLPKKKLLVYHFDQYLKKGKNEFKLVVHDMVGNTTELKATLYRK